MGDPVLRILCPRTSPFVPFIVMVRTMLSPKCCVTSSTKQIVLLSTSRAVRINGMPSSNRSCTHKCSGIGLNKESNHVVCHGDRNYMSNGEQIITCKEFDRVICHSDLLRQSLAPASLSFRSKDFNSCHFYYAQRNQHREDFKFWDN